MKRRDFVKAGVTGTAALTLPFPILAQQPSAKLSTARLTDRITLLSGAGANITIFSGSEGALLVDGGLREHAQEVLSALADVSRAGDASVLFNTNWRPEHTGLNETLGRNGATIIAHENTKLWMGNEFVVEWENRKHEPSPAEALPNQTFYTTGDMAFADERIEYGYLAQGHTDGDIYVFFPDSNVLVVSDLLAVEGYPVVDYVTGGWIGGMENATAALLEISDADTKVIPAVGPVQSRAALEAQLSLCTTAREAVRDAYRNGKSFDEFLAARPVRDFEARRGDATLFLQLVYEGAWGHVRELGGGII